MFVVYKITNKINNMSYIGSSIRVKYRWQSHIQASQNPNDPKYNYPLYQAFRDFGINNFSFEIIADDFNSIWDMEEYEQSMIDKYNSLKPNGYNQTRATHSNNILSENCIKYRERISQKCAKVDKNENILEIYSSYHEAARLNNREAENDASLIRKVCKGIISSCFEGTYFRDLDKDNKVIHQEIKNRKGRKSLIGINIENPQEERFFESISKAADELKSDRTSIEKCIQGDTKYSIIKGYILREIDLEGNIIENNIKIEDKIKDYNETNPIINGERHNLTEWLKIYNLSKTSYYKRRKNGMGVIEAIITPKRR